MLVEHGFAYDSSAHGRRPPVRQERDGLRLLELPVHWSLDDWPRFGWSIDLGGNVGDAAELYDSWLGGVRGRARRGTPRDASRCTPR